MNWRSILVIAGGGLVLLIAVKSMFLLMSDQLQVSAAFLVLLVALMVALAIPGINFVAGPMAPLIGGFVAGNRVRPRARDGLANGLVLGATMLAGVTGLLILNAGRVTPDPPYSLFAAFVVSVLSSGPLPPCGPSTPKGESPAGPG